MIIFHVFLYTKAEMINKIQIVRMPNITETNDIEAAVIFRLFRC